MHKEVTSKGEIVTHIHPYDFTNKQKHHHKSDAEIHFLDLLFQGTFIESDFITFEVPIISEFTLEDVITYSSSLIAVNIFHAFLRGPPSFI